MARVPTHSDARATPVRAVRWLAEARVCGGRWRPPPGGRRPRGRRGLPRLWGRQIGWWIGLLFGKAGAATAFAEAAINRLLPDEVTQALFAVRMVGAGVRMLQRKPATGTACAMDGGRVNWSTAAAVAAALVARRLIATQLLVDLLA